jgi:putative transposase
MSLTADRIIRTFKFRLLPRRGQHRRLRDALGHTRDLYNAALEERIDCYRKTGATRSYVAQTLSLTELRADPAFAVFPTSLQYWPLKKLDHAFTAFFRRVKAGENPGFPRFKGYDWFNSFGFAQDQAHGGWRVRDGRLYIKGVGRVRIHMHRPMPSEPISCVVKRDAKGWVVCLACEVSAEPLSAMSASVGIDVGLSSLAALSTGETIPNPRPARRAQAELRRRSRALSRCKRGSRNRRKAKARVVRLHESIANTRRTGLHTLAARIVRDHDLIAIEDLKIKNMVRSSFGRDIHDAGWGTFRQLLIEKAEKAARTVALVRPHGTSQTCPDCGAVKPKLLSERVHACPCGCVLDRDVAAARVILHRAITGPGVANAESARRRRGNTGQYDDSGRDHPLEGEVQPEAARAAA